MTGLAIIDVGYGNTDSIRQAFQRLGGEAVLTRDPAVVAGAERLVLPGVGSAGYAMELLRRDGLADPIRNRTKPTLGICLGMQIMFDATEEGETAGLGLIPGRVRALQPTPGCPVPHMGWTRIDHAAPSIGLEPGDYVYFAHSYACDDTPATAARVTYGDVTVPAAVRTGALWGAQFHPERSSKAGASFLTAFLKS